MKKVMNLFGLITTDKNTVKILLPVKKFKQTKPFTKESNLQKPKIIRTKPKAMQSKMRNLKLPIGWLFPTIDSCQATVAGKNRGS